MTTIVIPKITGITSIGSLGATSANYLGGETITLGGSGFSSGCTVFVDNVSCATTFVSNTSVTFTGPAKAVGTYHIYLYSTDGSIAMKPNGISFIAYTTPSVEYLVVAGGGGGGGHLANGGGAGGGAGGLLTGTTSSLLTNTNYSFSIIERRNTAGGFFPIISSGGLAATDKDLAFAYRNDTTITHAQWNDDIDYTISGYAGTNEPLHYWIATQSSTNGRIGYSGNTQIYNNSTKKNLLLTTSGNFIIGGDIEDVPNYWYFNGEIYEVLVFTQSLYDIDGTNTISTIYNNQLSQYGT